MDFLALFVAFLVGLLVREFLPSYLREKGRNVATKQDISEITDKVESVRQGYSEGIECAVIVP